MAAPNFPNHALLSFRDGFYAFLLPQFSPGDTSIFFSLFARVFLISVSPCSPTMLKQTHDFATQVFFEHSTRFLLVSLIAKTDIHP